MKYRVWKKEYNQYMDRDEEGKVFIRPNGEVVWYHSEFTKEGWEIITDRVEIEYQVADEPEVFVGDLLSVRLNKEYTHFEEKELGILAVGSRGMLIDRHNIIDECGWDVHILIHSTQYSFEVVGNVKEMENW